MIRIQEKLLDKIETENPEYLVVDDLSLAEASINEQRPTEQLKLWERRV